MRKVFSPVEMETVLYKVKPDGIADVWIRKNQQLVPVEGEETNQQQYSADEVFCRVNAAVIKKQEIEDDSDFWFESLSEKEDGCDAGYLGIVAFRSAKLSEISLSCEVTIFAGVDVEISTGKQHFSLTLKDQLNLFGKQAQIAAGKEHLEYHQDGDPCVFYTKEDMELIIAEAMKYVSYHTTYCNSVNAWAKGCSKASEIAQITYGAEVPEKYRSEVLAAYMEVG